VFEAGCAPGVILAAAHINAIEFVPPEDREDLHAHAAQLYGTRLKKVFGRSQ
jgi:hypothetical protein